MKIAGKKKREDKVDSIYDKIQRELDDVTSAEQDVRREFAVLNEALIKLNYVNKRYGRGVIDVEDLIYHHLLTQDFQASLFAMQSKFENHHFYSFLTHNV